jgi:aminoglycoside 3-N-acetyltransferase
MSLDSNIAIITTDSLTADFERAGLYPGQILIIHTSMKALGGYIVGAEQAVVDALMAVITPEGTLMMPTHSSDNTDPATWRRPPVPEAQWDIIRAAMPPYRPESTPTNRMGRINECFRNYPGVVRSGHPAFSFGAWGKHAEYITANQALDNSVAEQSPIGRLYELDGWVGLLGVGYHNNTSLHLADYRAHWRGKVPEFNGSAMLVNGERRWVTYRDDAIAADDFEELGAAFEQSGQVRMTQVGAATLRLMRQRALVDFAVGWLEANRPASLERCGFVPLKADSDGS